MTANIFVDFDGLTERELSRLCNNINCSGDLRTSWQGTIEGGVKGFVVGFRGLNNHTWIVSNGGTGRATRQFGYAEFQFLDFDGDGALDTDDAYIAIDKILDRVRVDFAPYDVQVSAVSSTNRAIDLMRANPAGDALVVVTGGYAGDDFGPVAGGNAPFDRRNRRDDAANVGETWATAHWIWREIKDIATPQAMADVFLNLYANLISHEVGHKFGIEHVEETLVPARSDFDPRGITLATHGQSLRNANWPDIYYPIRGGDMQNAHQTLLENLGPSPHAWATVLQPGELTIHGGPGRDIITLSQNAAGDITVGDLVLGRYYSVDPAAQPHLFDSSLTHPLSLNQWNTPIRTILFYGGDGDDELTVDRFFTREVSIYGGAGNDRLTGGNAVDFLDGGPGGLRHIG